MRPAPAVASAGRKGTPTGQDKLSKIDHIVVIYEENHSFDYLYDGWEGVNGRSSAGPTRTTQLSQAGAAYHCLLQTDVNLTSPPQAATCTEQVVAPGNPAKTVDVNSAFQNRPFTIDDFIAPADTTCPAPGVFAANGVEGPRPCRRLHARPRTPLLTGAVPAQRRPAEPVRHRE